MVRHSWLATWSIVLENRNEMKYKAFTEAPSEAVIMTGGRYV